MSHPEPNGPAARQYWRVGDEMWNPVTRERAVILETPWAARWAARGRS